MKDWDSRIIGMTVEDNVDDFGFDSLTTEIEDGWSEKFSQEDLRVWINLITCQRYMMSRDAQVHIAFYLSNLSKNFGHPVLNPVDGIKQLRENSKKEIHVDDKLAKRVLWKFRESFVKNFFLKRGRYPIMDYSLCNNTLLKNCIQEGRLPTPKESKNIPLSAWEWVHLKKNFELNLDIDEKDLLKDTACSPPRDHWFIPYDQCAFKHLYNQDKPRNTIEFQPRVLIRYLQGDEGELAQKVNEQENYYYNHNRDDITQLCRKERELNTLGRVFCKQTYEMRLMQVALEKSVGDNVLPFIEEQTMTNSELEVIKRMDKVASSISQVGHANVNLDLSKWNQLQRHDLNKYLFNELDELHGKRNLYSDSHLWFNRCMVLLGSRLTPPEIGEDGEPIPGDYCHYDQFGGLEGMRQKAWTITTIMIIKLALDECNISGETMGQGDNQVIHLTLNKDQQRDPQRTMKLLLNTLDNLFRAGGLKLKMQETWYSRNLFEYSKVRYFKKNRIDDSLKRLNRLIPDINEGFPSLASYLTCSSTCTENLSRNYPSPIIPFFTYSLEAGNTFQRKNLANEDNKLSYLILLNSPSVLGGLPVSNMFQHSQRGCPDPLVIWIKIWQTIRQLDDGGLLWRGLLHVNPVLERDTLDPITLVEDIYSLNIKGLPNFERKAREVVEEFLPKVITNPQVTKLIGATREDLNELCSKLITMRPYIANLAHEILRNSTEGIQLQLLGSFTNVQTINKMINESGIEDTIYLMGKEKDKEAIDTLSKRLCKTERQAPHHVVEELLRDQQCSYKIAFSLREITWRFPIEGITSPIPSEQVMVVNLDNLPRRQKTNCIVAQTSHSLRENGPGALTERGPFSPYLGSSTPEKMLKPKLSVINPNPTTKSIAKLFYIRSYLERMCNESNIINLIDSMIDDKLASLPPQFRDIPLSDWCGINYGGSYEHRFKASSQKRSALYSLSTTIATHLNMNTNMLGQALRGNEDYNLFFQELFLFIQNYCSETILCGEAVPEEYGIPLLCYQCTHRIYDPQVELSADISNTKFANLFFKPSILIDADKEHYVQTCTASMSVEVGRKIAGSTGEGNESHDFKETIGVEKTNECTERLASNLMTEFRSCDLSYMIIGLLQFSRELVLYIEGKQSSYPQGLINHLAFLTLNSGREDEIFKFLDIPPVRHSLYTQSKGLMTSLAESLRKHINKHRLLYYSAALLTGFEDDTLNFQMFLWRSFIHTVLKNKGLSKSQYSGIRRLPTIHQGTIEDWHNYCSSVFIPGLILRFRYPASAAILMWRDLKNDCSDLLSPILPLTEKISRLIQVMEAEHKHQVTYPVITPPLIRDEFSFSPNLVKTIGYPDCPLWVKYVHHMCRPIGRISTAASKMIEVISNEGPIPQGIPGLVITLAEGSGGILSLFAHMFPFARLVYNTLQDDEVEIKDNIMNIKPPALIGDACNLIPRLVGLESTCMGCTDITKTAFQEKLIRVIEEEDLPIIVFSMDAELKSDIDNFDKLEIYLPIVAENIHGDGIFVNKMFLTNAEQIDRITELFNRYMFSATFIKPSASHPHNNEVYVVGRYYRPGYPRYGGFAGETKILHELID